MIEKVQEIHLYKWLCEKIVKEEKEVKTKEISKKKYGKNCSYCRWRVVVHQKLEYTYD